MSPHAVNDLASSFVQMAKAFEELPQVQAENRHLLEELGTYAKSLESRELHIIELKAEIDKHLASIRSLEVARDDAELRFLVLEDKTNTVEQLTDSATAMLEKIKSLIVPPKPEPVSTIQDQLAKEGHGIEPEGHGSSSDHPVADEPIPSDQGSSADSLSEASWATQLAEAHIAEHGEGSPPSPGQNEADPTATGTASPSADAPNTFAHSTDSVTTAGKYSNKLYEDHPYYVSYDAWIAGGGTEHDYHARRSVSVPITHTAE